MLGKNIKNMFDLGLPELLIILLLVLMFFGANRLPKIAKTLGESTRELRKAFNEDSESEPKNKS